MRLRLDRELESGLGARVASGVRAGRSRVGRFDPKTAAFPAVRIGTRASVEAGPAVYVGNRERICPPTPGGSHWCRWGRYVGAEALVAGLWTNARRAGFSRARTSSCQGGAARLGPCLSLKPSHEARAASGIRPPTPLAAPNRGPRPKPAFTTAFRRPPLSQRAIGARRSRVASRLEAPRHFEENRDRNAVRASHAAPPVRWCRRRPRRQQIERRGAGAAAVRCRRSLSAGPCDRSADRFQLRQRFLPWHFRDQPAHAGDDAAPPGCVERAIRHRFFRRRMPVTRSSAHAFATGPRVQVRATDPGVVHRRLETA